MTMPQIPPERALFLKSYHISDAPCRLEVRGHKIRDTVAPPIAINSYDSKQLDWHTARGQGLVRP